MADDLQIGVHLVGDAETISALGRVTAAERAAVQSTNAQTASVQQATSAAQSATGATNRQTTATQSAAATSARYGQGLSAVARGLTIVSQGLSTTNPQIAQQITQVATLTQHLGQNVSQLGLLGGALTTVAEEAAPMFIGAIDEIVNHMDDLFSEARVGLIGLSDVTDRMLGVGQQGVGNSASRSETEGRQTAAVEARRRAREQEAADRARELREQNEVDDAYMAENIRSAQELEARRQRASAAGLAQREELRQSELDSWARYYAQLATDEQRAQDARLSLQDQQNEIFRQDQEIRQNLRDQQVKRDQQTQESAMHRWQAVRPLYEAESQGLTAVLTAANSANDALTRMHQQTLDSGQVWGSSMTAIANEVSNSIGNDLTGAFQGSLGAILDGSKSFDQAMGDMAKSVIKSLTIQAIVNVPVEIARGLGSYPDPVGMGTHFAAAGVWAGVAGIAAGVGAATGAFGGGAGAGNAGASAARATSSSNASSSNGGGGVTHIYVNMPPSLMTTAERGQFLTQAFTAARRQGYRTAA